MQNFDESPETMQDNIKRIAAASLAGFEFVTNGFLMMAKLASQQTPEVQAKWAAMGNEMALALHGLSNQFQNFFQSQKANVLMAVPKLEEPEKVCPPNPEQVEKDRNELSRNVWNSREWLCQVPKQEWLATGRKDSEISRVRPRTHDAYVSGIPWCWGVHQLFQLFRNCGKIEQIFLPSSRHAGTHRGFGFVRFWKPTGLENAVGLSNRKMEGFGALELRIKVNSCLLGEGN